MKNITPHQDKASNLEDNQVIISNTTVATVKDAQGNTHPLNIAQFGDYILHNYTNFNFMWADIFNSYRRSHNMDEVLSQLKSGLDQISCDYIDKHEQLLDIVPYYQDTFLKEEFLWTDTDKALRQHYEKLIQSGTVPFLQNVNCEWGSSLTNMYGLYDLPQAVINQVAGKAIVDGGAYIGDTVLVFKHFFTQSKIIAFEPVSKNYEQLTSMFQDAIDKGTVEAINLGLGAQKSTMRISRLQGDVDAMASVTYDFKVNELYEDINVITLDSYVNEHQVSVGLIKLDVEGFEEDILKGSLKTITTQKPILVIAMYHHPEQFYGIKSYLETLNLGYKFRIRRSCLSTPLCDLVLIAYQD